MADPKYKAGVIALTQEQMNAVEMAMEKFKEHNGVTLSRSQMLTMLAYWYVKQPTEGNGK